MFMLPLPLRKVVFPAALNAHRRKDFVRRTGGNANSAAHSVRFRNNNGFRTAEAFALKLEGWLCDRKGGGGRNENAIIAAMNREISLLFSFPNSELLTIRHVVRIKVKPAKAWNSSAYRHPPETPGAVHKEINTEKPQSFIEECCSKGTFAGCSVFRREYTMFILKNLKISELERGTQLMNNERLALSLFHFALALFPSFFIGSICNMNIDRISRKMYNFSINNAKGAA